MPTAPARPRFALFQSIRPLDRARASKDLLAGVTLAAMNIPQALGYTRIAGTPVVTGLYTLLLPVIAFAALGSSRYLVVAADSATAAILAGGLAGMAPIASPRYVALASLVALLTGAWLFLARILKLGFLAEFLSQTVLVGFLTGVGFQVAIAVLGEMLGVEVRSHSTLGQLATVARSLSQVSGPTLALSAAVVACILAAHAISRKAPGPLLAVVAAIAASRIFDFASHGIAVIGAVPGGLPSIGIGKVTWSDVAALVPIAGSCFVMIVAQSAATARAYAVRHHQRLEENDDLAGLAAANLAAGLTGTFVVNGSPTQTAMVESSGGQSQLAQLSTAAVVALVLLFLTGPLEFLPRSVLGAVVFTIAIRLIDVRSLRAIRRESPGEYALAVTTAAVVILLGVEPGILLAMALSLLRIVHHSYHPRTALLVTGEHGEWRLAPVHPGVVTEPGLVVYRFDAPLFYYNANRFCSEILGLVGHGPSLVHVLVVDAGPITKVDYTAARTVRQLKDELDRRGTILAFAHVQSDLRSDLDRHHLTETIGASRLFDTLRDALAAIHAQKV